MSTDHIVALLLAERDKLNRAIEALGGSPVRRRGRPPKNPAAILNPVVAVEATSAPAEAPKKRKLSAAGRKAIADAAKKRWALIKSGKAASPFAKKKAKA